MLRKRLRAIGIRKQTTEMSEQISLPSPTSRIARSSSSSSLFHLGFPLNGFSDPDASKRPRSPVINSALGIAEALNDDPPEKENSGGGAVVLGSKLRVLIPSAIAGNPLSPAAVESPRSPIEFGIKTKNPLLSSSSSSNKVDNSPRLIVRSLSAREMELSEEYTCVISHGPNPKTTHIFDDCIVETCDGEGLDGDFSGDLYDRVEKASSEEMA